ncbi:MAG: 50S ribosomal protein L9 [Phycisphaerales bacterium]
MARSLKLLLTENVENTGIVGDVVNVRKGYARNYLLPRGFATQPSDELVKQLQAKRAEALKQLDLQKEQRKAIIEKLKGAELAMVRSCNDQGILYAAVTQQDIATALAAAGHVGVTAREIRIGQNVKRIDNYEIHVKFDAELDTVIKLHINADRKLDLDRKSDEKPEGKAGEGAPAGSEGAAPTDGKPATDGKPTGDKPRGDRPQRKDREDRPGRFNLAKMDFTEKRVIGWGDAPAKSDAAPAAPAKAKADGGEKAPKGEKKDKPAKK